MTLDQKRHTQESRARGAGHPTAAAWVTTTRRHKCQLSTYCVGSCPTPPPPLFFVRKGGGGGYSYHDALGLYIFLNPAVCVFPIFHSNPNRRNVEKRIKGRRREYPKKEKKAWDAITFSFLSIAIHPTRHTRTESNRHHQLSCSTPTLFGKCQKKMFFFPSFLFPNDNRQLFSRGAERTTLHLICAFIYMTINITMRSASAASASSHKMPDVIVTTMSRDASRYLVTWTLIVSLLSCPRQNEDVRLFPFFIFKFPFSFFSDFSQFSRRQMAPKSYSFVHR
jgi:hypothetical protein